MSYAGLLIPVKSNVDCLCVMFVLMCKLNLHDQNKHA